MDAETPAGLRPEVIAQTPEAASSRVGVVIIGRNEGDRLARGIAALEAFGGTLVYVDSGSSDGSVALAREACSAVVELDDSRPFSAARARNAGFERIRKLAPDLAFVQFVDGDSELDAGWLAEAEAFLADHRDVAMVCGRLREFQPDASAYHRLAAIEWDAPTGEVHACGGNAMVRVDVFDSTRGYSETMIAGEEPELCHRLRRAGHRVVRLPFDMARHDSGDLGFAQWWRRAMRSGHAYAEILYMQARRPDPRALRNVMSIVFWGGALPAAAGLLAVPTHGFSLFALLLYAALFARIARAGSRRGLTSPDARLYAVACIAEKPLYLIGIGRFLWNRLVRGRSTPLIESPPSSR